MPSLMGITASGLGLLVLTCGCHSICGLSDWKTPASTRVGQEWRSRQPGRFLSVHGDFDGDGSDDEANLVVRQREVGVLVCFGAPSRSRVMAYQAPATDGEIGLGIRQVPPGRYLTACGKGYFECGPGEGPHLLLDQATIGLFKHESYESVLKWDATAKTFKQIWLSD